MKSAFGVDHDDISKGMPSSVKRIMLKAGGRVGGELGPQGTRLADAHMAGKVAGYIKAGGPKSEAFGNADKYIKGGKKIKHGGVTRHVKPDWGPIGKSAFGVDHDVEKGLVGDFKAAGQVARMAKPGGIMQQAKVGATAFGGTKSGMKLKSYKTPAAAGAGALGGAGAMSMFGNRKKYA